MKNCLQILGGCSIIMDKKSNSYIKLGDMFDENGIRSDLWIEWVHDESDNTDCCPICKVFDDC